MIKQYYVLRSPQRENVFINVYGAGDDIEIKTTRDINLTDIYSNRQHAIDQANIIVASLESIPHIGSGQVIVEEIGTGREKIIGSVTDKFTDWTMSENINPKQRKPLILSNSDFEYLARHVEISRKTAELIMAFSPKIQEFIEYRRS